ncbi:MAG TPA: hypothetical protein VMW17_22190 [Candidatus Binatia bacterium]|nr:hypothetical protein [Candidatus Binatia bacterium]
MVTRALIVVLGLLIPLVGVRADIVEWQDAEGVRHFTNSKEEVPGGERARVVIAERPAPATGVVSDAPPAPGIAESPKQAQVVYDYSLLTDAYAQGVVAGLALARDTGSTTINQPIALSGARGGDDGRFFYSPPLVTTSFDRGRSRHLTLRMLLEDQFQLDRDGPYVVERLPPGLGPNLNPFLPRGLPYGYPVGGRVLF